MTTLTMKQIEAIETAGREVAKGWLKQGDLDALDGVDFAAEGDWQHVRKAAIAAGVAWDADSMQPDLEIRAEVWAVATAGYQSAITKARQ